MRIKELFEKYSGGRRVMASVKVPFGQNPFRDLWDALMRKADKRHKARGRRG
jgi:hypothetical protein